MTGPDATISTPTETTDGSSRFIAVRVLAHPDPRRAGDFAPLFDAGDINAGDARDGKAVTLNRLSPDFRTPAGERSGPLASTRISRTPLEVSRHLDGLRLHCPAPVPGLQVNGHAFPGERVISADELQAGVIVLLGRDLALWIGWLELIEPAPAVAGLIGESTVMRQLRQQIHRVADLDVPILLRGETGVGKELVAAAIHKYSRRANFSYVAVSVAGVPPTMAASELFGHKRGAFTGASEERKGYFAQASGGTLFLDEIGDISFDVQALLLRAVQEKVIQPLGGSTRQVDVRLIAATDSDLESAVVRREFREPLLRRFSFEIRVPPLRARRDDIGMLFFTLLRARLESTGEGNLLAPRGDGDAPFVPAAYVAQLALHDWPGNVRELANVALKLAIENRGRTRARIGDELRQIILPRGGSDPPVAPPPEPSPAPSASTLTDADIVTALRAEGFRRERAARRLGVSKSYLYKRLETSRVAPRAQDIPTVAIRSALTASGEDVAAAAERLSISERALRLHLKRIKL